MNQLHFIPKVALVTGAGSGRDLVTAGSDRDNRGSFRLRPDARPRQPNQ